MAGLGVAALATRPTPRPLSSVRLGIVGTGSRGTSLLRELLKLAEVRVQAICDVDEAHLAHAQKLVVDAGHPKPEGYSRGPEDWRRLCDRNDLDVVLTATPWKWHVRVSVAAMKAGKHAAVEVPAAQTVEECWELVETAEKESKYCTILENACYDNTVLMILNMLRDGLLGEPLFAEAGYMHDLRAVKFGGEAWRLDYSVRNNGNLYPTHPLGPLSWWFDINREDKLSYLVSMSSKGRGLRDFALRQFGAGDSRATQDYALGDVNVTLIHTEIGHTLTLYHDTNSPRPFEVLVRIQGSKGAYHGMLDRMFVDGRSSARAKGDQWRADHNWEDASEYRKQYEHRLWKAHGAQARGGGHGGVDYLMMYRLIRCLREGVPPDIDVYDAAAWSVIVPLTQASVAGRSRAVDVPDFTRGKWKTRRPIDPDTII